MNRAYEVFDRRGARRHRLARGAVRADIEGRSFGAVRDISDRGGVFIEGWDPPEEMSRIRLDADRNINVTTEAIGRWWSDYERREGDEIVRD